MKYDNFLETDTGVYYWSSEGHQIERKLNDREEAFLRLIINTPYYDFAFVDHLFNTIMKNASDKQWDKAIAGSVYFIKSEQEKL